MALAIAQSKPPCFLHVASKHEEKNEFLSTFKPHFFSMAIQKKKQKKRKMFSFLCVFFRAGYSKILKSQSFDLSQILSQSNWLDWWLKAKLRLTYLQKFWTRALTKKGKKCLFRNAHDGSGLHYSSVQTFTPFRSMTNRFQDIFWDQTSATTWPGTLQRHMCYHHNQVQLFTPFHPTLSRFRATCYFELPSNDLAVKGQKCPI